MTTSKFHFAISFFSIFIFACPITLAAQDEELHQLDELLGEYTYSLIYEQPGGKSMNFGKAKIQWLDSTTINTEFSNHDITFVIEYNSAKKVYLFTYEVYRFDPMGRSESEAPLFSIKEINLDHAKETGYTHHETDEEKDWVLDVIIEMQDGKIKCGIKSMFEGKKFEHYLNFLDN